MVWCACTAWKTATSFMSSQLVQPSHCYSGHNRVRTGQSASKEINVITELCLIPEYLLVQSISTAFKHCVLHA